jgi:hypothetical protein
LGCQNGGFWEYADNRQCWESSLELSVPVHNPLKFLPVAMVAKPTNHMDTPAHHQHIWWQGQQTWVQLEEMQVQVEQMEVPVPQMQLQM